jgi:hypothetical protein
LLRVDADPAREPVGLAPDFALDVARPPDRFEPLVLFWFWVTLLPLVQVDLTRWGYPGSRPSMRNRVNCGRFA